LASSANRYARAIFELASEEGKVDDWARQLAIIREVLDEPTARSVLDNPSVAAETRIKAVEELDLPGIGPQGMNLMRMLVASGRVGRIDEIAAQFEVLADDAAGRGRARPPAKCPWPMSSGLQATVSGTGRWSCVSVSPTLAQPAHSNRPLRSTRT